MQEIHIFKLGTNIKAKSLWISFFHLGKPGFLRDSDSSKFGKETLKDEPGQLKQLSDYRTALSETHDRRLGNWHSEGTHDRPATTVLRCADGQKSPVTPQTYSFVHMSVYSTGMIRSKVGPSFSSPMSVPLGNRMDDPSRNWIPQNPADPAP